jgi:VWFA-related protein
MSAANCRRLYPLCAVLFLAFMPSLPAQQTLPVHQIQPDGKGQKQITLDLVVTAGSGSPVAGLTQGDLQVFDGKQPQAITSFIPLNNKAPAEVLLVLDAINAPFTAVSSERDQILRFLRTQGKHLPVPVSLAVVTDTNIYVQSTFSTDGNMLSASLEHHTLSLRMLRRSTGFYGASERTNLSLHALTQLAAREGAKQGRKLIFWISPGWPLLSGPAVSLTATQQRQIYASVVQITTQLRQNRITLYALNAWGATEPLIRSEYYLTFTKPLVNPYEAEIGNLALQVFARQSGGLVVNSNDLGSLLKRALEDTSAYYEIVYDKPAAEQVEEFHPVEVRVDKPGLTVRTIHGYYSRP